jgi:hypothetical protein
MWCPSLFEVKWILKIFNSNNRKNVKIKYIHSQTLQVYKKGILGSVMCKICRLPLDIIHTIRNKIEYLFINLLVNTNKYPSIKIINIYSTVSSIVWNHSGIARTISDSLSPTAELGGRIVIL